MAFVALDPEDQKIMTKRLQEGIQKTMKDMKYLKPELREKIIKRMQKMATRMKKT